MSTKAKSTANKEEAKPAVVPKLRFPEFRGAKGWRPSVLAHACDMQAGKFVSASNISERHQAELFPCYGGNGLRGYTATHTHNGSYPLIGRQGALCGNVRFVTGQFHATEHAVVASPRDAIDVGWLYYSLDLLNLNRFATGQAQPGLSVDVLENVALAIPPLEAEQQTIAECLSSVDELMDAQARKVDVLKTHKKGLMQQLFPRESETQPRLRFPEFQNAGEWEEVALGDIAEIKLGKMLDRQKHTSGHLMPYLNNLAVRWNEVNTTDLPKMYFNDRELDRFGLKAGDVVVCEGGEPGRAAVWDGHLPDLKFQKAIHRVRFNVPFEPKILVLHLENLAGTKEFEMLFTGAGIKHLTGETFCRLKVPLIPHDEQQRIAECLSSLDALISAETQKLEALKTHKRGLMQQLFPSPEETADL
jgi:type I restriction enzyme S subunit